jgi:hypothetical protein
LIHKGQDQSNFDIEHGQQEKATSVTQRELLDGSRKSDSGEGIHTDRLHQVNLGKSTPEDIDPLDSVLERAEDFLEESQQARTRFDPLRCTRKAKVQPRKLAKSERMHFNRVIQESPGLIRDFIKRLDLGPFKVPILRLLEPP